eukprot:gene9427-19581_t
MVKIDYIIHGDVPEAGTKYSVNVDGLISLSEIHRTFPFLGQFHFRLKTKNTDNENDFVWVDLIENDEPLRTTDETLVIQALVLSLPDEYVDEAEYENYLKAMKKELVHCGVWGEGRPNRIVVGANADSSIQNKDRTEPGRQIPRESARQPTVVEASAIHIGSVTKKATSIWNTVKSTASAIQQNISQMSASSLSDVSESNLSELSDDISSPYTETNPRHCSAIADLWNALFPGTAFQRNSAKWKEAGFQNTDPIADLRASGILALRTMSFLCERHIQRTQTMLSNNKANIKTNYPFAVVGINLTLMLGDMIGLRDQKYFSIQSGYWELFENKNVFFEIFCICFFHVDRLWTSRKAVRSDFANLMGEVKGTIAQVLATSPKSISDLRVAATDAGMM